MNFKKTSIFSRNRERDETEYEENGGMLAVWGSPSSGKSVTAVKLAKSLSEQRKNVVLLLCDMTAPMLPCIIPPNQLDGEHSLGSVLAAAKITLPLIQHNLVTLKNNQYVSILGLLKGENEYTYPLYTENHAKELISEIRNVADYVIVDCSSYIASDILSAVALMEADSVIRLANADLKSISYLSSQLPLLDGRWEKEKHYRIAAKVKPQQPEQLLNKAIGKTAFTLPYSQEVEEQYIAGNLFADLTMKESKPFRKAIAAIGQEVF